MSPRKTLLSTETITATLAPTVLFTGATFGSTTFYRAHGPREERLE